MTGAHLSRNPPPGSGVKAVPYKKIPALIGQPRIGVNRIEKAVCRFKLKKGGAKRGRKVGYRKTTAAEDQAILAAFKRVRRPLGILVEATDVWRNLEPELRSKVSVRTVRNRLGDAEQAKGANVVRERCGMG